MAIEVPQVNFLLPRCGCHVLIWCRVGETPLMLPKEGQQQASLVRCSGHMCPIRVHWHVKTSYREYWRVKITVSNLNLLKNYSAWNLVALHPNLQSVTQVFSFNYRPLTEHGSISKYRLLKPPTSCFSFLNSFSLIFSTNFLRRHWNVLGNSILQWAAAASRGGW